MTPLIVVAHDAEAIRGAIERLLGEAGYAVATAVDGAGAIAALERGPAAMVLDVAIPGVLAYQVVEELRRRGSACRVVLVASIYNRTGYKRRPTSLYGADDYVEQHHIPDDLVPKLRRLIGAAPVTRDHDPESPAAQEEQASAIRDAGEARLGQPTVSPPREAWDRHVERAERLARLIVADVALYNGDALDRAAHSGDTTELDARLRVDLEEGRLLFELRIAEEIRRSRDFIGEALAELVRRRTEEG